MSLKDKVRCGFANWEEAYSEDDVREAVLAYINRNSSEWVEQECTFRHCSACASEYTLTYIKGSKEGQIMAENTENPELYEEDINDYIFNEIFGDFEK